MEILSIIDKENNVVGKEEKKIVHEKGLRHRVSAVLVEKEGKFLITTASDKKVEAGGLYHSVGGHVQANESYEENAVRETKEETGLKIKISDLELLGLYWFEKDYPTRIEKERFQVYKVLYQDKMGEVELNEEHYNEQWFSLSELKKIYNEKPDSFSAPLKHTMEIIFKLNK